MSKKIVFSGVQPTGEIHLGNYLGAIKQFLNFQDESDSIFCIVDQHAITIFQDPKELRQNVLSVLAIFLASGLDPKNVLYLIKHQLGNIVFYHGISAAQQE